MTKQKLYFEDIDDDYIGTLEQLKQRAITRNQSSFKAFEAVRDTTNNEYFFCKHFQEVGEKGNCGKECEKYKPRNNK